VAHDVRAVANAVLELAEAQGQGVTNLALNKIIYFLHAGYLHEHGVPLVSAKIEAWDHGPVFREIYHQFKKFGRESIKGRAQRLDPSTGAFAEVPVTLAGVELDYLRGHGAELLKLSPGKLVDMSHVRDGPWYVARFGSGRVNPGVEITEDLIRGAAAKQARH
jgi:uncharacterized phage-associated protein